MNHRIFTFVFVPVLYGCVTTGPSPEQVGVGRFEHIRSQGNTLVAQRTYKAPLDCELNLRKSWSTFLADGSVPKCSTEDLSEKLPYKIIVLNSEFIMTPTEIRFGSPDLCDSTANIIRSNGTKSGNAQIELYCASKIPAENNSHKSASVENSTNLGIDKSTSIDDKLKRLKRLFEAGLITSDVYADRQKALVQ